jgi:hypothetical protein
MEPENKPKISRRDAIKLIAAAGAVSLAALPDKWSSPLLQFGALPAHAQTSVPIYTFVCPPSPTETIPVLDGSFEGTSTVQISPVAAGVSLTYSISTSAGSITSPIPNTGTVLTDGTGTASVNFVESGFSNSFGQVTVVWSFTNPNGTGLCTVSYPRLDIAGGSG